jgi:hypothetical protein
MFTFATSALSMVVMKIIILKFIPMSTNFVVAEVMRSSSKTASALNTK